MVRIRRVLGQMGQVGQVAAVAVGNDARGKPHPLRALMHKLGGDTLAALVLVAATVAALIWANIGTSYTSFWDTELSVGVGGSALRLSLAEWVNDALMVLFFFGIGLDVRRELTLGELRRPAAALLPVAAAIGGLVVPAAVFLLINHNGPAAAAWGAVISTDTAFALGMLALLGPSRASRVRVFLLAFSVVDDIGALSVIALFYTDELHLVWLVPVAIALCLTWWLGHRGVWRSFGYIVLGIVAWFCTLQSGVHATLAGVLLALLMPVHATRMGDVDSAAGVTHLFRQTPDPRLAVRARQSITRAVPLNQRLSEVLTPYTQFLVVPLFALSNAGVQLSGEVLRSALTSWMTWGVVVGLVLGKFVGISAASALVLKFGSVSTGRGLDLPRIMGVAGLGGIGFTISLLVIELGLTDEALADEARIGVLLAAVIAMTVSWLTFALGNKLAPLPPPEGLTLPKEVDPASDHLRGEPDAPLIIVVYADMGEVYRTRTAEVLQEVRERVGGRLGVAYRHHVSEENLVSVALALEAAGRQGKFWDLHDLLIRRARLPEAEEFLRVAETVGIDGDRLHADVTSMKDLSQVRSQSGDADDAGLPDRPAIFLNGRRVQGLPNTARLLAAIHQVGEEAHER